MEQDRQVQLLPEQLAIFRPRECSIHHRLRKEVELHLLVNICLVLKASECLREEYLEPAYLFLVEEPPVVPALLL
jgi:hypothetical protein